MYKDFSLDITQVIIIISLTGLHKPARVLIYSTRDDKKSQVFSLCTYVLRASLRNLLLLLTSFDLSLAVDASLSCLSASLSFPLDRCCAAASVCASACCLNVSAASAFACFAACCSASAFFIKMSFCILLLFSFSFFCRSSTLAFKSLMCSLSLLTFSFALLASASFLPSSLALAASSLALLLSSLACSAS